MQDTPPETSETFVSLWAGIPLRAWYAAISLGCFGVVAIGMMLQHLLQLSPCPLCIFQRVLYLVVGAVAALGVVAPLLSPAVAGAIGLLAAGGLAVALWQSWMQAYPLLAPTCNFSDPNLIERLVYWLGGEFPDWFLATGLCTSVEWDLFGLSMANWSVFLFAGLLLTAVLLLRARGR
jgi:protein dithiol:quinone oxidoreductase